jgi:hypothetical protein
MPNDTDFFLIAFSDKGEEAFVEQGDFIGD